MNEKVEQLSITSSAETGEVIIYALSNRGRIFRGFDDPNSPDVDWLEISDPILRTAE